MRPHVTFIQSPKQHDLPPHVKQYFGISSKNKLRGVDISHYQGKVDFTTLINQKIDFVYLKATEGTEYTDPTYADHVSQIQKINKLKNDSFFNGAYHFYDPDKDSLEQASHFVSQVKSSGHNLPPVLDIEVTQDVEPETIKQDLILWLNHVEKALSCRPVLYSNGSFWSEILGKDFNKYSFWLADYAKKPTLPQGLANWHIWQYSSKGRLSGVENGVDLDVIVKEGLSCHG